MCASISNRIGHQVGGSSSSRTRREPNVLDERITATARDVSKAPRGEMIRNRRFSLIETKRACSAVVTPHPLPPVLSEPGICQGVQASFNSESGSLRNSCSSGNPTRTAASFLARADDMGLLLTAEPPLTRCNSMPLHISHESNFFCSLIVISGQPVDRLRRDTIFSSGVSAEWNLAPDVR